MRVLSIFIYFILAIVSISFAALNASPVKINLYFVTYSLPICVWMVIILGLGFVVGLFFHYWRHWRLRVKYRKLKKQIKLMEKDIKNFRTISRDDTL